MLRRPTVPPPAATPPPAAPPRRASLTGAVMPDVVLLGAVLLGAVLLAGCTGVSPAPRPGGSAAPFPTALPTRAAPEPGPVDGSSRPVADPVYPAFGNPAIDVQHYDLALTWAPPTRTLTGTATLTVRVVSPVTEIALDFSQLYTVDAARLVGPDLDRGAPAPVRRGDDLVLPAAGPLPAGAVVTASIRYHGTPPSARFPGARNDVPSIGAHLGEDGALWAMQEPYGAFTWFPCSDQPSDKALFDVTVTSPAGWYGVSSGALAGISTAADGAATTRWHGTAPSATYLVALAVDRFDRFDDTGPDGLPVTYWVRRADRDRMLPVLRRTPEMVAWLERRFGRYPFRTLGVVVVPDASAMETQTMVSMGPLTGYRGETVLLHELAHQWFGDAVTPTTWRDLWLNEGFATYAEMLYTVDRLGTAESTVLRVWRDGDARSRKTSGPPGRYDPGHFADHNVYYGPALMLHELRHRLGDPRFFAVLHDWVQHHLYGSVDRAGFERWLADYTGENLQPVVGRWLDSPVTPA